MTGCYVYVKEAGGPEKVRPLSMSKTVKLSAVGRKRVTRGTQEGFFSFSIGSFQNFFKGLKTCSGWRKSIFASLNGRTFSGPPAVRFIDR